MLAALSIWRLFPRQIEAGLSRYHHRRIDEWLRDDFTMSSRELLALIEEFPEDSELVKASSRTYRVAEVDGKLMLFAAVKLDERGLMERVELPEGAKLIAEFVDWTHDRKIAARQTRELAIMRMEQSNGDYDVDMSGLDEPLRVILDDIEKRKKAENVRGARSLFRQRVLGQKGGD